MTNKKENLIRAIVAGVFTVGGLLLVAYSDWRIAVGVFFAMWGNNQTERNLNRDEFRIKNDDE